MERLALVDEAIERPDVSRALYEWREAYGAAEAFERLGDAEVASRARRMVPPPPVQPSP